MPADRSKPVPFDTEIVNQLACPACHGPLRLEATALVCAYCGRQYPIVDGIPVLIVNRVLGADS